jgi:uncharacterized protein (TIGR00266 family)
MSRELQQGANSPLPDAPEIVIGLGWEPERPGGQDADPSAFLLSQDGRVDGDEDFVFYNNPRSTCGSLHLLQGAAPDRQQFRIRLSGLPPRVERIAVCLTLSGGGSFAGVGQLHIRVLDEAGAECLIFRPQTQGMVEAALILGEIYQRNNQWKFRAVGQGFAGGLAPLARYFGVDVADEPAEPPPSAPPIPAVPPPPPGGAPRLTKAPATGALPSGSQPLYSQLAELSYELLYPGAYTLARVDLPQGRQLRAQSDAMVAMSPTVEVAGKMQGGWLGGVGRLLSGESLFLQTLSANRGPGSVYVAPSSPGDIAAVELDGEGLMIQKGGFLACTEGIEVNTQMQNLAQGLFSREGFFIVKAEGRGLLLLESYGAIHRMDLGPGEQKIVDNGHLVAWSRTMDYRLEAANLGIVAAMTSGEAIVCRFTGPGKLFIQTRQPRAFGVWISRLLPGG